MNQRISKDQARFRLACYAVTRLAKSFEEPWTMRELFDLAAMEDPVLVDDLRSVALPKSWRRAFIQRLIDVDLVTKHVDGSKVTYEGKKRDILKLMIKELEDDSLKGQTIRHFIFPSDYDPSDELKAVIYSDQEDEEEELELDTSEDEEIDEEIDEANESILSVIPELLSFQASLLAASKQITEQQEEIRTISVGNALKLTAIEKSVAELKQKEVFSGPSKKEEYALKKVDEKLDSVLEQIRKFGTLLQVSERLHQMKGAVSKTVDRYRTLGGSVTTLLEGLEKNSKQVDAAVELTMEALGDDQNKSGRSEKRVSNNKK